MKIEQHDRNHAAGTDTVGLSGSRADTAAPAQLDPKASAALAQAVLSARKAPHNPKVADEQRLQLPKRDGTLVRQLLVHSALVLVLAGSCWFAAYAGTFASSAALQQIATDTMQHRAALARLDHNLDVLQSVVSVIKDNADRISASNSADQTRLAQEVERVAQAVREPGERIAALEARIDRMEQQLTTAIGNLALTAPSPRTEVSAPTDAADAKPALADAKPSAIDVKPVSMEAKPVAVKEEMLDGWIVREVYDGAALVESRNRRLFEVVPGGMIPGIGRVESIERRSGRWIVLTDKGIIGTFR